MLYPNANAIFVCKCQIGCLRLTKLLKMILVCLRNIELEDTRIVSRFSYIDIGKFQNEN